MNQPFSALDISNEDHIFEQTKYVGKPCQSSVCFLAVSPESSSLISALTEEMNPVGFFLIDISDISNPVDYANGSDCSLMFLKSFRNEVFKLGDITLVNFTNYRSNHQEYAHLILQTVAPKEIYVFDVLSKEIVQESKEPTKFFEFTNITSNDANVSFPMPNSVSGISASIIAESFIQNELLFKVLLVEKVTKTIPPDSFKEWTNIVLDKIDKDRASGPSSWPLLFLNDVVNHAHHNLLVSQNSNIPQ